MNENQNQLKKKKKPNIWIKSESALQLEFEFILQSKPECRIIITCWITANVKMMLKVIIQFSHESESVLESEQDLETIRILD